MLAISYTDVLKMVIIPTLIYYTSVYLIAEFNAPPFISKEGEDHPVRQPTTAVEMCTHLLSASSILIFLAMGFSPETICGLLHRNSHPSMGVCIEKSAVCA